MASLRTSKSTRRATSARSRSLRIKGSERLGNAVVLPGNDLVSTTYVIGGQSLQPLRLGKNFTVFEKYFVHRLTAKYVPSVPTTQAGTVHMIWDTDPEDPVPTGADTPSNMSRCHFYASGPISRPFNLTFNNQKLITGDWMRQSLYCSPVASARWSQFGFLSVYVDGATGMTTDSISGYIDLEYDITFMIPTAPWTFSTLPTNVDHIELGSAPELGGGATTKRTLDGLQSTTTLGSNASHGPMFKAAGSTKYVDPGNVYEAILDTVAGSLLDSKGRAIYKGAKVFLKAASLPDYGDPSLTASVGGVYLDREFTNPLTWLDATSGASIALRAVKHIALGSAMAS